MGPGQTLGRNPNLITFGYRCALRLCMACWTARLDPNLDKGEWADGHCPAARRRQKWKSQRFPIQQGDNWDPTKICGGVGVTTMDLLEYIVDNLITKFKKRDENGKRTFEHRWNPTTFGGGVDITTIPGVPEVLDQHKAEFGVIRDPMCLIAEAMNEYGQYCTARLRLETRIESHIKAGLTTMVNASSPTTPLHA
ncbi:unnamed protein product [Tilletia laevis]|uniref:Uncharacterized protein n=2 Tax=Tilletia TaxID=13289 RepID=A0A9N8M027_9BASI|nr:unnamed protein product [Tilletia laevis]